MPKPRIAAIVTEYRHWSHADVVVGRLLAGSSPSGVWRPAQGQVVSLWVAQHPANDMSPDLAPRHGFKIYPTIREALTLGGPKLAVDAVCFIGEHGDYPENAVGQTLYPRFELFNEILELFEAEGRGVPTFFDKHLSYNADLAAVILRRVRRLKFPFLCGSSIPVTVRTPRLELPLESPIRRAVSVSYGPTDAYGFHALEVLQCMMERRRGGETGIASVQMFEGPSALTNDPLLDAALRVNPCPVPSDWRSRVKDPVRFALEYRDGSRGDVYLLNGVVETWLFAAGLEGRRDPVATHFSMNEPDRPLPHFDGLVDRIENMYLTGREPYPPERTLLTTIALALALAFESKRQGYAKITDPLLNVQYRSPEKCWFQDR